MSRIGAMPIIVPGNVQVTLEGNKVRVNGSKGTVEFVLTHGITGVIESNKLLLLNNDKQSSKAKVMWGSYRNNINNSIEGFSKGFCVELEVTGIGYKIENDGKCLLISVGFSHGIKYKIPTGIEVQVLKYNQVFIKGFDKRQVHMVASDICKIRKYDVYKGKGIFIKGKYVHRKEVNKKK